MNIKKYKYIISLEGERFLCYYDLIAEGGFVIKTGFDDVDLTPNDINIDQLKEHRAIFNQAISETDMSFNHTKTVEYVKQDYKNKLFTLREKYFTNYSHQMDGLLFPINAEYVNYYDHIQVDIKNGTNTNNFVDNINKIVKWGGGVNVPFDKFLEYYEKIAKFISDKNFEYIYDQQTILQIQDEDFNGNIPLELNTPEYEFILQRYTISKNATYNTIKNIFALMHIVVDDDDFYRINLNILIRDGLQMCEDLKNTQLKDELTNNIEELKIYSENMEQIIQKASQGDRPIDITIKNLENILTKWSI